MNELGICILAGGEATRLPRKLERELDGKPLLARVYENLKGLYPVYISSKGTFEPALDRLLDCPVIVDRWNGRGPLAGALSVFSQTTHARMFVCAGDAPFVDLSVVRLFEQAWQPEVEGVVAQPLLAIYDRDAFLREGLPVLKIGSGAVRDVAHKLRTKAVTVPQRATFNINTEADLKVLRKYEVKA